LFDSLPDSQDIDNQTYLKLLLCGYLQLAVPGTLCMGWNSASATVALTSGNIISYQVAVTPQSGYQYAYGDIKKSTEHANTRREPCLHRARRSRDVTQAAAGHVSHFAGKLIAR
jgi:hypothetical protein